MEESPFSQFWTAVSNGMGNRTGSAFREYLPKLKASLESLDVISAYWSRKALGSQRSAQVLLCGAVAFGRIEIEMRSATTPEDSWSHVIRLSVLPWSEVTEIKQDVIREGKGHDAVDLRLSEAVMCLRSGDQVNLLPPPDTNNSGGVRAWRGKVEPFNDPAVFIGAVIEAQRSR